MKKSEFSEKFFEILVDHLLLNHGFQIFIPSQNKENKLGYDALINNIKSIMGTKKRINGFALQYKIVEKYKKPQNKKENFKFKLHPAHNYRQHNKLCKCNQIGKFIAAYCVPNFVTIADLYLNLNGGSLLSNSMLIFPKIHIIDNNSHYITFGHLTAHQHSSEQNNCDIKNFEQILKEQDAEHLMFPEVFIEFLESINSDFIEDKVSQENRYNYSDSFLIAYKIIE